MKSFTFTLALIASPAMAGLITGSNNPASILLTSTVDDSPSPIETSNTLLSTNDTPTNPIGPLPHANHIFNAVRAATRQWDSSWFHNGMSFFPATVPEGLLLYHGTWKEEAVVGLEWLAFEPEHALMFARGRMERGPPPGKPPGGGNDDGRKPGPDDGRGMMAGEEMHCEKVWETDGKGEKGWKRKCEMRPLPHGKNGKMDHSLNRDFENHEASARGPRRQRHDSERERALPSSNDHSDMPWPPQYQGDKLPHGIMHDVHPDSHPPTPPRCHNNGEHSPEARKPRPFPGSHFQDQHPVTHSFDAEAPPPRYNFTPSGPGYLHHYRTKHSLSLLLIDGMSAGKTGKGTLDSQDYILREQLPNSTHRNPMGDFDRAQPLCNLSRNEWGGKVDGFIRMECGFEIILCDFEKHLGLERAQLVPQGQGMDSKKRRDVSGFRMYRAVADRFHGIGGGRVEVDFENMVSAYSHDLPSLFVSDIQVPGAMFPRLVNQSAAALGDIRGEVANSILRPIAGNGVNWQAIADMFVQRYADTLQYLVNPTLTHNDVLYELESLLRPFITDGNNETGLVTKRCIEQSLPDSWPGSLAGRAIQQVGETLCHTLIMGLQNMSRATSSGNDMDEVYTHTVSNLTSLIEYLDWPIWHFCQPSCSPAEVCVLPIWPITGDVQDRIQPSCKNVTQFAERRGEFGGDGDYWRGHQDDDRHHPRPLHHEPCLLDDARDSSVDLTTEL